MVYEAGTRRSRSSSSGSLTAAKPDRRVRRGPAWAPRCYLIGDRQDRPVPDLALEVIWTSGGIDKLEIYRRLGVPEVWFRRSGKIRVHVLGDEGFEEARRSRLFPELDLELVESLLDRRTALQAVRALRETLGR